ncbi:MAG: glycoside hydrolase family 16 protein [Nitritalea sp.]
MLRFISSLYVVLLLTVAQACNQSEVDQQLVLPSNLEVSIRTEARGEVVVSFSATNANFFRVSFGTPGELPQRVSGTEARFTYSEPGDFTIRVQAHTTEADFIVAEEPVSIAPSVFGLFIPETGFVSPESYPGYSLVWQDEFSGNSLSADWVHDLGDGCPNLCGWGNNELQWYRRENVRVENGYLIIQARREAAGGRQFTSSRIKTQGRQSFQYGRIDIRAALPKGQGIWPALWMLGDNITEVGWPRCGEIDIMEMVGGSAPGRDNRVHGTLHWDNNGSWANFGGSTTLEEGIFNDNFHVFSIIWEEDKITWLLDDQQFFVIDTSPAELDEFRNSFFFLFNVAVGGNWPGNPDDSTRFPQQMVVDYVRVFQRS